MSKIIRQKHKDSAPFALVTVSIHDSPSLMTIQAEEGAAQTSCEQSGFRS